MVGNSYGGWTALAVAGVEAPDLRIRAVAGLQPFARSLPHQALARIAVPTMPIVGARDETCPPDTEADRVSEAVTRDDAHRIDLAEAGHQACSDVGLYLELEAQVSGLPDIVAAFLASMAEQVTGRPGDPWRPTLGLHLRVLGAWLASVFELDRPVRRTSWRRWASSLAWRSGDRVGELDVADGRWFDSRGPGSTGGRRRAGTSARHRRRRSARCRAR